MSTPFTPYAGTSGWSGSETSKERAETDDSNGTTTLRQQTMLTVAASRARQGVTVKEVRESIGMHHGQASSVLSVLHKEGLLCRLTETRDRCKVYVLPEYVGERDTEPSGRQSAAEKAVETERERIMQDLRDALSEDPYNEEWSAALKRAMWIVRNQ